MAPPPPSPGSITLPDRDLIQAIRYLPAWPLLTLLHGGTVIVAALFRVRHRTGGVYDRAARRWGRRLMRVSRIRCDVSGREHLDPDRPCVYIVNHVSAIDIWALLQELPGTVRFVFKKELLRIPVFGGALMAMRHISIDRTNRGAAFAAYDDAARAIRGGISAIVFAEGTRSRDGQLLPFKKGPFVLAIAAQVPIIPIHVGGAFELMPRKAVYPRKGTITLRIGAPIATTGLNYEDRDRLSAETERAMRALAGAAAGVVAPPSRHP